MGFQFHETGYGKKFFEWQLPELVRQLKRIADQLERQNDNAEKLESAFKSLDLPTGQQVTDAVGKIINED